MKLKDALEWMLIETAPVAITSKYGQSAQEAVRKHLANIDYAKLTSEGFAKHPVTCVDHFHSDLVWNTALFAKVTKLSTAMEEGGISVGDIFKIDNVRPDNKVWVSSMDGFACWLHRDNLEPYDMAKQGYVALTSVDKIRGRKVEREVAIFRKNLKVGQVVKFKYNNSHILTGEIISGINCGTGELFISGFGRIKRTDIYPIDFKYPIK